MQTNLLVLTSHLLLRKKYVDHIFLLLSSNALLKVYQLAIDKLRVAYPSDDKVHTPLQIHVSPQPLNPHHQVNKKVKHGSDRLKMSGLYVQAASVEDTPLSQASTSSSTKVNTNPAPTTCSKGKAKANVMAVD